MDISPNAGKKYFILDANQIAHNLENETEECGILASCDQASGLYDSFENLQQIAFRMGITKLEKCPHCFKE